jgi:hypothetical protein
MNAGLEPDSPKPRRIVRDGVRGAVRAWLRDRELEGTYLKEPRLNVRRRA